MRICFISALYAPWVKGGAERAVEDVVARAVAEGHEVWVITTRPWGGVRSLAPSVYSEHGTRVVRFFPLNIFWFGEIDWYHALTRFIWHVSDTFNLHAFFVVWRLLRKIAPTEIYTHNLKGIGYTTALAIRLYRRFGIRWTHTLHDTQLYTPRGIIIYGKEGALEHTNPFAALYRTLTRALFSSPDEVRAPSQWLLDFYRAHGFFPRSKMSRVSHAVHSFHAAGSAPRNQRLLLFVGQLENHKGVRELIGAFRVAHRCAAQGDACPSLHIVGDGRESGFVRREAYIDSHLVVYGRVGPERVRTLMGEATVLIYPSLCYENAPLTLVEAITCGTPIIASRVGGIPELLEGHSATLVEPGNVDQLANAMREHMGR